MRQRLVLVLAVVVFLAVLPGAAQLAPKNSAGVSAGHVHLTVQDPDKAKDLFVAIGGKATAKGRLQLVEFPGVFIAFRKADPTGGSIGSVVNHIGFLVKNIQETAAKFKAAGGTVEPGTGPTQNWFMTPDGARLEINERPSQAEPIVFDHIHFFSPDAKAGEEWYSKFFGALDTGKNDPRFEEAKVPGVLLRFNKDKSQAGEATKGRAIDHIGFDVANLHEVCQRLQAAGIQLASPERNIPPTNLNIAFVVDPWGTNIEITEHLTPEAGDAGSAGSH
ncbi:MAG TPA: VOC family protein [Terriglobales bacterium]|nr:VOC family protein [Terriglobales bacterium]